MDEVGLRRGARHRRAHGVAVVLDDVDDRQLPQLGHVEALVDLALIGGAVAEIGQADVAVVAILVGEGDAGAERHRGADDAVAAVELLVAAEHVHGAALAVRIAVAASGQLRHDAARIHAAGQHVAVVAIAGDHLVAVPDGHLHADDHGLLADVEVAEAADEAHAVHLAGTLLETADGQHLREGVEFLLVAEGGRLGGDVSAQPDGGLRRLDIAGGRRPFVCLALGLGHPRLPERELVALFGAKLAEGDRQSKVAVPPGAQGYYADKACLFRTAAKAGMPRVGITYSAAVNAALHPTG